jgi:hypothetical protein
LKRGLFTDFCWGWAKLLQVKQPQVGMPVSLEQATRELAFEARQRFEPPAKQTQQERMSKASRLAELRQVWEKPRALEELERLATPLLLAWRSGRQALVFFAPGQPLLIPLRD